MLSKVDDLVWCKKNCRKCEKYTNCYHEKAALDSVLLEPHTTLVVYDSDSDAGTTSIMILDEIGRSGGEYFIGIMAVSVLVCSPRKMAVVCCFSCW